MFMSSPLARGLIAGSIAFAVSLSAQAGAQVPPAPDGPPPPAMNRVALEAQLSSRFDALDTNKDGTISPDERKAGREAMRARMFARVDTDKNGAISPEEFATAKPGAGGPGGHRKGKREGFMAKRLANASETKADFVARRLAMFDRVDADHDGTISPQERDAARGKMRQRRGPDSPPPPPPGG